MLFFILFLDITYLCTCILSTDVHIRDLLPCSGTNSATTSHENIFLPQRAEVFGESEPGGGEESHFRLRGDGGTGWFRSFGRVRGQGAKDRFRRVIRSFGKTILGVCFIWKMFECPFGRLAELLDTFGMPWSKLQVCISFR